MLPLRGMAVGTLCILMAGCITPQLPVRVLPKGEVVLNTWLGGYTAKENFSFTGHGGSNTETFIPTASAGIWYGMLNDVTVHANVFPAMLGYQLATFDAGLSGRLCHEQALLPELTGTARALCRIDFKDRKDVPGNTDNTSIAPELSLTGSYSVDTNTVLYFGTHQLFSNVDAPRHIWLPGAYAGISGKNRNSSRVRLQGEIGVITSPALDTRRAHFTAFVAVIFPL